MIAGLANIDSRSMIPLFQTQARGGPVMAQIKIGVLSAPAFACALSRFRFQGIVVQDSFCGGIRMLRSSSNSASVSPSDLRGEVNRRAKITSQKVVSVFFLMECCYCESWKNTFSKQNTFTNVRHNNL